MTSKPGDQSSESTDPKQVTLLRALGPRIAIAVVVGNVIGSGIYLKPGVIASTGASFGLIISVWAFGGLLCILGALCFAELATMLPRAGGLYVYLREAYGRPVAFLFGWTDFLIRLPGSIAALSVAFVGILFSALGWRVSSISEVLMCVVLIVSMAWVNIIGVLWGGRLQMVFTVIKASTLAMVCAVPFVLIPFVEKSVDISNYSSMYQPSTEQRADGSYSKTTDGTEASSPSLMDRVFGSMFPGAGHMFSHGAVILLAVMWAYNGWHGITPLAEEVRDPQRNIPLALFGGIGLLIVLYISANIAYHGVLSMQEMANAGEDAAVSMLKKLIGRLGVVAMSGVIMCSTFGAINTNFLQAPRIPFAMGRDGVFFRRLGSVHVNYRTPAVAIMVSALLAIGLIVVVAVAKVCVTGIDTSAYEWPLVRRVMTSLQDNSVFNLLTDFVIFAASIFYTLAVSAVVVLRIRRPEMDRPYKTWGYPIVPILFIVVYIWFLAQIYIDKPLESRTGLALILLGVPVYFAYQLWSKREFSNPK